MASIAAPVADRSQAREQPGAAITVIAALMALWSLGFAAVNVFFEITDYFVGGPYADYVAGITVMNWLVVVLKAVGAAAALLSVAKRPRLVSPGVLAVVLWGAFATLGVYALGSVAEAVGMVSGLAGSADQIDVAGVGYVLFFLSAVAGYGVLAVSYSRRHGLRKRFAVLGVLGAPLVLGLLLLALPTLLAALGVLPAP